jgi:hypothetical protein
MDEDSRRRLKGEIEKTDSEIEKIEESQREKEEEKLREQEDEEFREKSKTAEDDNLKTKSKILSKDILEAPKYSGGRADQKLLSKSPQMQAMGEVGPKIRDKLSQTPALNATSIGGIIKELLAGRWAAKLEHKADMGKASQQDIYRHLFMQKWLEQGRAEKQIQELAELERNSGERTQKINHLSLQKNSIGLDEESSLELQQLEREEAKRYYLRQRFLKTMPLKKQKELNLEPLGYGAYGVMPYTYLDSWSKLSDVQRASMRWYYDNNLLRWQNAIIAKNSPKKARTSWFQKKSKKGIESMFDDMDEEIYCDKKFKEMVKKGQAQLEDMEEELVGYDRLTVSEEKEVKKIFDKHMKEQLALAKEEQYFS